MTLSQFPSAMPEAVRDIIRVADILRHIRNSSGDLTFRVLHELQDALHISNASTIRALEEGSKAPQASEAFMVSLGGPKSLLDYNSSAIIIGEKASAWNNRLEAALLSMTPEELIGMAVRGEPGLQTKHIEYKSFIPAHIADPLRESEELAELLSSFETVGA